MSLEMDVIEITVDDDDRLSMCSAVETDVPTPTSTYDTPSKYSTKRNRWRRKHRNHEYRRKNREAKFQGQCPIFD